MPLAIAFWIIYLLWIVFAVLVPATQTENFSWRGSIGNIFLIVLVGLLGGAAFGSMIHR